MKRAAKDGLRRISQSLCRESADSCSDARKEAHHKRQAYQSVASPDFVQAVYLWDKSIRLSLKSQRIKHHEYIAEECLCVVYNVFGDVKRCVGPRGEQIGERAFGIVDERLHCAVRIQPKVLEKSQCYGLINKTKGANDSAQNEHD